MFAVLLLSVAFAWMLSHRGDVAVRRGEEILGEIRSHGLPAYWTREPQNLWYLVRNREGQVIGWEQRTRVFKDGVYIGVHRSRLKNFDIAELWSLNETATAGKYLGQANTPVGSLETHITLQGDAIQVSSSAVAKRVAGEFPANYIPEGLAALAFRLAAAGEKKVIFRMILDGLAIVGEQVNFVTVIVEPDGPERLKQKFFGQQSETVYHFDERGIIRTIESPDGSTSTLTGRDEVGRHFSEVRQVSPFANPGELDEPGRNGL